MNKSTGKKVIRDISEFDESISLYQLVPGGRGKGIMFLKRIVDQVHQDTFSKVHLYRTPSILICGKESRGLVAKAYMRALGLQNIVEIEASFIEGESYLLAFLHGSSSDTGFIIHGIERLHEGLRSYVWEVLKNRKFSMYNFLSSQKEVHSVRGFLVLTSSHLGKVSQPIVQAVDHVVQLESFTQQQLELIVLQRLKYSGIEYESEQILKEIVEYGNGELQHIIRFIKDCYVVLRSDGRDKLMLSDIQKAVKIR